MDRDDPSFVLPDLAEARFAANLRVLRERRRMSQVRLAEQMMARGWPWRQQTVTKIENGQRMVRYGEAVALTGIFGISIERFTWPSQESDQTEQLDEAGAHLRRSYEAVAEAVFLLLTDQQSAEAALAGSEDSKYERVQKARREVAAQLREYSLDKATEDGISRYGKSAEGEESGSAGPDGKGEALLADESDASRLEGASPVSARRAREPGRQPTTKAGRA